MPTIQSLDNRFEQELSSYIITEGVLEKYPINPKCGKKIEGYYTLKVTVPGTYILEYHMSNSEETFCKV